MSKSIRLTVGQALVRFVAKQYVERRETLRLALAATKSWREKRPVKISEITA
jgi:hypothetical protein